MKLSVITRYSSLEQVGKKNKGAPLDYSRKSLGYFYIFVSYVRYPVLIIVIFF